MLAVDIDASKIYLNSGAHQSGVRRPACADRRSMNLDLIWLHGVVMVLDVAADSRQLRNRRGEDGLHAHYTLIL